MANEDLKARARRLQGKPVKAQDAAAPRPVLDMVPRPTPLVRPSPQRRPERPAPGWLRRLLGG